MTRKEREFEKEFKRIKPNLDEDFLNKMFDYFVSEAEDCFGEKAAGWVYAGTIFIKNGPYTLHQDNKIKIALSEEAKYDYPQFVFQLSHEVFHFISPSIERKSKVFDEGIATWFQKKKVGDLCGYDKSFDNSLSYTNAYSLVCDLFDKSGKNNIIIKELREKQPMIFNLKESDFEPYIDKVPKDLIKNLLKMF